MSDIKLVNYGELDCKLSDYLATDGVIILTAMHLSEMVDDVLKLVNECSYPTKETEELRQRLAKSESDRSKLEAERDKWMQDYLWITGKKNKVISEQSDKLHTLEKIAREGFNTIADRCCEPCCIYAHESLKKIDELTKGETLKEIKGEE